MQDDFLSMRDENISRPLSSGSGTFLAGNTGLFWHTPPGLSLTAF